MISDAIGDRDSEASQAPESLFSLNAFPYILDFLH